MLTVSRLLKNFILLLIKMYQLAISPFLPMACRHMPSCSQYSREAIERFGVRKGMWLGAKRICRCHPWGSGGYDPLEAKE